MVRVWVGEAYPTSDIHLWSSMDWYSSFARRLPCHSTLTVMPGYGLSFLTRTRISPPVSMRILKRPMPLPEARVEVSSSNVRRAVQRRASQSAGMGRTA